MNPSEATLAQSPSFVSPPTILSSVSAPFSYYRQYRFAKVWSYWLPTSIALAKQAEERLLSWVFEGTRYSVRNEYIHAGDNENDRLNTFIIEDPKLKELEESGTKAPINLVIAHGYSGGLGVFYRNFLGLLAPSSNSGSEVAPVRIYAIDWLGQGLSSRARFDRNWTTEQTEDYFVRSLERWRQSAGLDKFVLLGHSLGGYLSVLYAMRYPERVEKLILVSPAGVPRRPEEPSTVATTTDPQVDAPTPPRISSGRKIPGWIKWIWESNITPQDVVRFFGPMGRSLVLGYTSRRFPYITGEELQNLTEYLYHVQASASGSEYALGKILDLGAWGKNPLIERIEKLQVQTLWMYGERDWMDLNAGRTAAQKMPAPAKVVLIPAAGHHLHMDNPEDFNYAVRKWLDIL